MQNKGGGTGRSGIREKHMKMWEQEARSIESCGNEGHYKKKYPVS